MRCARCGTELIPGKKFCHACGERAGRVCPRCEGAVEVSFRFCPECGTGLEPEAAVAIPGERKRVTVLFCDLAGSTAVAETLDPEEYRELLDRYLELAFAEIRRFEGIVNQLAGDGLMALFGAPVAHEDAPERALRAALAIRDALARDDFALRPRIGVHTGVVVVGTVGDDLKMDYTAIGDTTNLAARLEALATPGSVLASEATHRLVRGRFRTRVVGPFDVKGKREPVTAHEVIAVRDQPAADTRELTPFVGRAQELAHLQAGFARVTENLAQVVAVVGDAGSGKSRLVHEFRSWLEGQPVELLAARGSSLTRGVPHSLWVDMLRSFFGISTGEPRERSLEKVREGLSRSVGERADRLFPDFCRILSLADGGRSSEAAAVGELIVRSSERVPVVMIFEDLHWIDDASREALETAISRCGRERIMIVVTHRPDYEARWQSAAVTQLQLRPLPEGEAVEIVRALAGGTLPAELEQRILRQGAGNPFYLEELTRALIEEGTLLAQEGRVVVTRPVQEIRIPDSVREVLAARLDRLRPEAKRVAQVAAVLGRQFRSEFLAALLADERIDVAAELARLEQRGILRRLQLHEFRFGESLTQEVAYQSLLLRERRRLHGRSAKLLEELPAERTPGHTALLAQHYARSDDRERGVELMLDAASEAERLPSYGDALRLYRDAWELAEASLAERPGEERLRRRVMAATEGVCRVMVLYGGVEGAADDRAATRGEELAEALGELETLASFYAYHGMLLVGGSRERFEQGVGLVEAALESARKAGAKSAAPRLSRALAWTYLLDGRFAEARETIDGALAELERLGDGVGPSDAHMGTRLLKCQILQYGGDFSVTAEEYARETHELARRASNRTIESGCASVVAGLRFLRGDLDQAERWAREGLAIGEEIGNVVTLRNCTAVLVGARCERGDRSVAAGELERLEGGLLHSGDLALNVDQIVEVLLELGKLDAARRIAEGAARSGAYARRMTSSIALGCVCTRLGPAHWGAAQRALGEGIELARRLGARASLAKGLLGLADLAGAHGEPGVARRHADAAFALFRELGFALYERRAERLRSSAR
jgi:class 3 adenylate cyclase